MHYDAVPHSIHSCFVFIFVDNTLWTSTRTMPTLTIQTNVKSDKIPPGLVKELVDIVASALGKPKSYVVVNIQSDQNLSWGGTDDAAAVATLVSIGQINPDMNKNTTNVISTKLEDTLGVKSDRFYLCFNDYAPANIGYTKTTFQEIFGGK